MTPSRDQYLTLNQRRYHIRRWGPEQAPLLVLLHGWMDSSATFQFLVDAFAHDWQVVAPDWRGFGDSQWNEGSYYFPDYLADLDALLKQLSPDAPVRLLGHSMGSMIAGIYAGICPQRIAKLVLVEGFGLNATRPAEAPGRYARWLRENSLEMGFEALEDLQQVCAKLISRNPLLKNEHAQWLAAELTQPQADGKVIYRADPRHKMINPVLYRLEEAMACWQRISAPVLWVMGERAFDHPMVSGVMATLDERRACFKQLSEVRIDAGHMIQWERPVELAAAVENFLLDK
ncbi:alpha/beta hydrolase [Chromobacterium sphagni]|uniref:Alpha/beta hydrolase n=1 Tax=Chromobacterium sphagni TaxID=1903179 RepID=A0A1S1X414_9NEIS|nr:alpha/beta hydrolase [Chromobacterium sphagni]OHX14194.1 alpha/beta hydrolase [Chromobacterium sphagni]